MAAAGGSCQSAVGQTNGSLEIIGLTDSAGGWLVFVGIVIIIYEAVVIAQRFLNVSIINEQISIVIIIVSGVMYGGPFVSKFKCYIFIQITIHSFKMCNFH